MLGRYPFMIAILGDIGRNPDPMFLRTSIYANRDTDPQPLIDYLSTRGGTKP